MRKNTYILLHQEGRKTQRKTLPKTVAHRASGAEQAIKWSPASPADPAWRDRTINAATAALAEAGWIMASPSQIGNSAQGGKRDKDPEESQQ